MNMIFLKQGKTNWKYILIVLILAALVGGGILGWKYWLAPPHFDLSTSKYICRDGSPALSERLDKFRETQCLDCVMKTAYMCGEKFWIHEYGGLPGQTVNKWSGPYDIKRLQEFKEVPISPSKIEDETANWKTYRNEEYGFEIKYPYWYQVSDKLVREGFYDYQISRIVSFSNVGGNTLNIYADNSSSNLAKCLKNYENKDLTQTKEIGGNKFYIYFDKVREGAMGGERGLQSQYRIIHNNYCYILHYEFSWRVTTGGTKEGGAEPGGTETPEQEAYIEKQTAELELMLSTFRFLK
jgi:hypothetical protein